LGFAAAIKYRTQGRIQITNYFDARATGGEQTREFQFLQEGVIDFAIGSTINWSPQVKELNLFALPFMFPSYSALDAVEVGDPGKRLFKLIEQKGVTPIAWGGKRLQGADQFEACHTPSRGFPWVELLRFSGRSGRTRSP
jgi:TRAP-type transport system periplasmic protein